MPRNKQYKTILEEHKIQTKHILECHLFGFFKRGKLVSDRKGKTYILIKHFRSAFIIDKSTSIPKATTIPELFIATKGLRQLLKDVNLSKASGHDGIPNRILKKCDTEKATGLTAILQTSINTGILHKDWPNANVSCFLRNEDKHAADQFN